MKNVFPDELAYQILLLNKNSSYFYCDKKVKHAP